MVVADVGAGTGYMSLRLAKRVGPSGKVYANDLQPEMLRRLRENAAKAGYHEYRDGAGRGGRSEASGAAGWIWCCWWMCITSFRNRAR